MATQTPENEFLKEAKSQYKDAPPFGIYGVTKWAYIGRVYDGDTCTVLIRTAEGKWCKKNARWLGIDTPEKGGKGVSDTEKAAGKRAGEFLRGLINKRLVLAQFAGRDQISSDDPYGRFLCTFFPFNPEIPDNTEERLPFEESFNQRMIDEGFAHAYNPTGSDWEKEPWTDEQLNEIANKEF